MFEAMAAVREIEIFFQETKTNLAMAMDQSDLCMSFLSFLNPFEREATETLLGFLSF